MSNSTKIDGFLLFPAAGLILSCIAGAFNAWVVVLLLWLFFTGEDHDVGLAVAALTLPSIVYLTLLGNACWQFFRKSKRTRKAMIAYYVGNFVINAGSVIYSGIAFDMSLQFADLLWLLVSSFSLIVLVPWFIYSKRVPVVFCR
ncbi:DUF2569 family protein [Enterobacteriaceae bacterium RIT814]|uniref:DUF2569 family protein n=1 Tax=Leclercia TaxID=83654 RepID=UPI00069C405F|nr:MULTISPECIES: DUF2569 family protein [Leclercia]MBM6605506.1 DUF2569 family protein [Enterobacteriaceae bacterium RIT 814]MEB7499949.1 DUF2569 family protein [Leclercia pneumoniae]